LPYYLIMDVVD